MTVSATDWQRRRGKFNHDWLKNQFLPAIGKMLNVLRGRVEDQDFLEAFPAQAFAVWEERQAEAWSLIEEVASSLSPCTIMVAPMWSEFATSEREWLCDLTHELWLVRCDLMRKIADAREAVTLVGTAFAEVRQAHWVGAEVLILHTRWAALNDRCRVLSRSIEQFPSEVGFT